MYKESIIDHLANIGFDPKMGARPLSRKIDEVVRNPLSKKILFEGLENCSIKVGYANDEVWIKTKTKQISTRTNKLLTDGTEGKIDDNGLIVLQQFKPKD